MKHFTTTTTHCADCHYWPTTTPTRSVVVVVVVVLLLVTSTSCQQFRAPAGVKFRHLAVYNPVNNNSSVKSVYVGAENYIYQLTDNLTLVQTVSTKTTTDNYNQILVIDSSHDILISCGNGTSSGCEGRRLTNLSDYTTSSINSNTNVANVGSLSADVSTVAIVTPGFDGSNRLYVGSTQVTSTDCTGVTSRSLDYQSRSTVFDVYSDPAGLGLFSKACVALNDAFNQLSVNYVAALTVGQYNYFLSTQSDLVDTAVVASKTISKISQVCQFDRYFNSFVEMKITCTSGSKDYNLVSSAVVVQPGLTLAQQLGVSVTDSLLLATFNTLSGDSALCVYSLRDIRRRFIDNVEACRNNASLYVGWQYKPDKNIQCAFYTAPTINESFCSNSTLTNFSPLVGTIAIQSAPIKEFVNTSLTAIIATTVDNNTAVFLGSADGRLIKMLVETFNSVVFSNISITSTGSAMHRGSTFTDSTRTRLYVLTTDTLFVVPVTNDSQFTTCSTCLASFDPFIGWCTLQARCLPKTDCVGSVMNGWQSRLSGDYRQCINITDVKPDNKISVQHSLNLTVEVAAFPVLDVKSSFVCLFDSTVSTSAVYNVSTASLQCQTPNKLPDIPVSTDNMTLNLSIRVLPSNVDIVQTPITLYDCSRHDSCSPCSSTAWHCQWCLHDNRCVDQFSTCNISNGINNMSLCPRLTQTTELLVSTDAPQSLTIYVVNLPRQQTSAFHCHLLVNSVAVHVSATLQDSTSVLCNSFQYTSQLETPQTVDLTVTWGTNFRIEGSANVTVFNCSAVSTGDCSKCLNLQYTVNSRFGCQWCQRTSRCQANTTCQQSDASATCPASFINSVYPNSGVIDGGTRLTINGTNLGTKFSDVNNAVYIAGVRCEPDNQSYIVSLRIVCTTGRTSSAMNGTINVTIGPLTALWSQSVNRVFMYKDPQLTGMIPLQGPRGGGTLVTLFGSQLSAGVEQQVIFNNNNNNNITCSKDSVTDEQIVCRTSSVSNKTTITNIVVLFDANVSRLVRTVGFTYTDNPVVENIKPNKGFVSGGCPVTLSGSNLDVSLSAVLHLNSFTTNQIQRKNFSEIVFMSPAVKTVDNNYTITVQMDGVRVIPSSPQFSVTADPQLDKFTGGKKTFPDTGSPFILTGSNLDAVSDDTVAVYVAGQVCNGTKVFSNQIQCTLPDKLDQSKETLTVNVTICQLVFIIGNLESSTSPVPVDVIVGVVVGVGVPLILIIFVVIVVFAVQYKRNKAHYKQLEIRFNQLETNVRDQCKLAFAELQTEIPDVTGNVGDVGVPFWDYRMYSFKLLFPGHTDHPVLHNPTSLNGTGTVGGTIGGTIGSTIGRYETEQTQRFQQLLCSQCFLVVFIRTLEQRKEFSAPDKAKIASLLTVFFLDKMDYATVVIKALLGDLITRSIEKKSAKLMFRRMESVVEKLVSNWLSLSLYEHLRSRPVGSSLFILYQAVKRQIEKGPVDAITGEARYSLSENRLLRDQKPFTTLMVYVQVGEGFDVEVDNNLTCKLLDCDTITQATMKLLDAVYVNTPYSRRVPLNNVELRWKTGSTDSSLPLHDEDTTTERDGGWMRVNCLSHYNVKDGSVLVLVSKKHSVNVDAADATVHNVHGVVALETSQAVIPLRQYSNQNCIWHLAKHLPDNNQTNVNNQSKTQTKPDKKTQSSVWVIPEIFLTRLLQTKMTLQNFIDDLIKSLLTVDKTFPPAVKYLFDFFDSAVQQNGITDPEVVHTWKSNSLPLRFWVNVMTNPQFVFDVNQSEAVDSCLQVIASAFMESFSLSEYKLSKDSPSSKLLFAKDIPHYRSLVSTWYKAIHELPSVSDDAIKHVMLDLSMQENGIGFNIDAAVTEIFQYANKFVPELVEALDEDPSTHKLHLSKKFYEIVQSSTDDS